MKTIRLHASISVLSLLTCTTLRTAAAPLAASVVPLAHALSSAPPSITLIELPKAAPSPAVRLAVVSQAAQPLKRRPQQLQTLQPHPPSRQTLRPPTPQRQTPQQRVPQRQTPNRPANRTRIVRPAAGSAAVQRLPNRSSSTRLAPPSVRQGTTPPRTSPQLAAAVLESLNTHGVWVDPSLRGLADADAIERAARDADFPVRVLLVRRVPNGFANVQAVAQAIHQRLELQDGLVIVATSDDARLGLFGADLDDQILNQIVEASAQTWTQEGYAGGVVQTLRLVAYERKLQNQARFVRIAVPGAIGIVCLISALALWIRRKIKHRARRAISRTLPTTIPPLDDDATTVESSSAEAV